MNLERIDEAKNTKKGVLASYQATFMEFNKVNENNRIYPPEIAKNKILTEKTKEALANNKLLGEINHPKERFDVDYEKVAINTTSLYYDEPTDTIKGTFDILDTPMGRILKTLVDYGTHISLSARAMGKTLNKKGVDEIQEESYIFKTFDAVTDPGFSIATIDPNKDAINESLKSLYESYNDDEKNQVSNYLESIGMSKDFLYEDVTPQDNVGNDNLDSENVSENKSDIDALISEYENIINILKTQLEEKDIEKENVIEEYNNVIDIMKNSSETQIDDLNNQVNEYKVMLDTLSNNLVLSESKSSALINELEDAQDKISKLEVLCSKVQKAYESKMSDLKAMNQSYMDDIESISSEVEDSNDAYNKLLEEYKELELKYNKLLKESQDDSFKLEESNSASNENTFTLVKVITESKQTDVKTVDALTNNLLNKLNKN